MNKLKFNQNVEETNLKMINTQVIYPIAINDQTCTIIIPNRGGSLDRHTTLVIPVTATDGCFLPVGTGIASLIQSCSLLSNGVVIAQNSEVGSYITMQNSFKKTEFRKRVLLPRTGCRENYSPANSGFQDIEAETGGDPIVVLDDNLVRCLDAPGKITLDQLQYNIIDNAQTGTSQKNNVAAWDANLDSFGVVSDPGIDNNNYRISSNPLTTANFYLSLEQIFPLLYGSLQLPTYLIETELSLVIRWSSNNSTYNLNERVCQRGDRIVDRPGPISCDIIRSEVLLLTDYLVPTDDVKNELTEQIMSDEGLVLNYSDLLFNNFFCKGLPAAQVTGPRNHTRYNFQLGLSNKVVRQIYLMFQPSQAFDARALVTPYLGGDAVDDNQRLYSGYNTINGLKNKYCSKALSYLEDGEAIQIQFNSKNIFNTPMVSSGHKMHELQTAYGSTFNQPYSCYDFADMSVDDIDNIVYPGDIGRLMYQKSLLSYTHSANSWSVQNLVGQQHYIGCNLQRPVLTENNTLTRMNIPGSGMRCGSLPVSIQIDRLCNIGEPDDHRDLIVCSVIEKTMILKGGQISVIDS